MTKHTAAATVFDFWIASLEAQAAMWTTLSHRVPMLMMGTASDAERTRMIAEKLDAVMESAQAITAAVGRSLVLTPEQMMHPMHAMSTALEVSDAAAGPFHRRLNANAKRLNRRQH